MPFYEPEGAPETQPVVSLLSPVLHQQDHKGSQGTPCLSSEMIGLLPNHIKQGFPVIWGQQGASCQTLQIHNIQWNFTLTWQLDLQGLDGGFWRENVTVKSSLSICWLIGHPRVIGGQARLILIYQRGNLSQVCFCLYQIIKRIYFSWVNNLQQCSLSKCPIIVYIFMLIALRVRQLQKPKTIQTWINVESVSICFSS